MKKIILLMLFVLLPICYGIKIYPIEAVSDSQTYTNLKHGEEIVSYGENLVYAFNNIGNNTIILHYLARGCNKLEYYIKNEGGEYVLYNLPDTKINYAYYKHEKGMGDSDKYFSSIKLLNVTDKFYFKIVSIKCTNNRVDSITPFIEYTEYMPISNTSIIFPYEALEKPNTTFMGQSESTLLENISIFTESVNKHIYTLKINDPVYRILFRFKINETMENMALYSMAYIDIGYIEYLKNTGSYHFTILDYHTEKDKENYLSLPQNTSSIFNNVDKSKKIELGKLEAGIYEIYISVDNFKVGENFELNWLYLQQNPTMYIEEPTTNIEPEPEKELTAMEQKKVNNWQKTIDRYNELIEKYITRMETKIKLLQEKIDNIHN